jgi:FAD-linked sulfhydryl oxidase
MPLDQVIVRSQDTFGIRTATCIIMSRFRRYDTDVQESSSNSKPCRACTDFQTFMKSKGQVVGEQQTGKDCPLDSNELGRNSWSLLHTIAAYYSDRPSNQQQEDMRKFFNLFSKVYPCKECADDMKMDLRDEPPDTRSRTALSQWLCRLHNKVNNKLGKDLFDCSKVDERWLNGWKDGSCG